MRATLGELGVKAVVLLDHAIKAEPALHELPP